MCYTLKTDADHEYNAFRIILQKKGTNVLSSNPLSFYVTQERADADARRLSLEMPGYTIVLETLARQKAIYDNGQRIREFDFRHFYTELSDAQYAATQLVCSVSHITF